MSSFQGPLLLAFEEDALQQPLELAVRRVSTVASSAQDKVSGLSPEASLYCGEPVQSRWGSLFCLRSMENADPYIKKTWPITW